MLIVAIMAVWLILSIPFGMLVGAAMGVGSGARKGGMSE